MEKPPTLENAPEKFPSPEEVISYIREIIGEDREYTVERELSDEKGLYLLEIRTLDGEGDTAEYSYMREGSHKEGSATHTRIDVVYYVDDIPSGGGDNIANYIDDTWVKA